MASPPEKLRCALVFPPVWYFDAVPADLSETAGVLRSRGIPVWCWDLSATMAHDLLGETPGFQALQQKPVYTDPDGLRQAFADLQASCDAISEKHFVEYDYRQLRFPNVEPEAAARGRSMGMSRSLNPAYKTMEALARELVERDPFVIAIACVHPDQIIQSLIMARLLRRWRYSKTLVLYGSLEDQVAPDVFLDDILERGGHILFEDFDGVIIGEAESALFALCIESDEVPNYFRRGQMTAPERHVESLDRWSTPFFDWVRPEKRMFPTPLVDLRLGRGCPWGKCTFCAIQSHHVGYRSAGVKRLVASMAQAQKKLGTSFFRIRDDLLTPVQLRHISQEIDRIGLKVRWTARARFEAGLTRRILAQAAAAGLEELWMGLESGSNRIRELMDKGVKTQVVQRNLTDAHRCGVKIRPLCIYDFPGETKADVDVTVKLLTRYREALSGISMTKFQLMRGSPLATRERMRSLGLELVDDELPAHMRMRYTVPHERVSGSAPQWERDIWHNQMLTSLYQLVRDQPSPSPTHGWVSSSVIRSGWPA